MEEYCFDLKKGELTCNEEHIPLHAKEFQLLEFFLKNSGELLSRNRILDKVWGYESETTTRTVDVHIAKLRQKPFRIRFAAPYTYNQGTGV